VRDDFLLENKQGGRFWVFRCGDGIDSSTGIFHGGSMECLRDRLCRTQVFTHFSLLRGASSPEELFGVVAMHGHSAIGLGDFGTVAGVVRAWEAQKVTGVRSIAGARRWRRLIPYPTNRAAWSRLTRLLTLGKRRATRARPSASCTGMILHPGPKG
jgi:hypothetical protein